jgi:hypothetical protein
MFEGEGIGHSEGAGRCKKAVGDVQGQFMLVEVLALAKWQCLLTAIRVPRAL